MVWLGAAQCNWDRS
jgi:hypothetical protein